MCERIARLDNEVSRDYHAYREAETAWKRSVATLNEWQHHRLELKLFLRDAFITQSQADLEVPSRKRRRRRSRDASEAPRRRESTANNDAPRRRGSSLDPGL